MTDIDPSPQIPAEDFFKVEIRIGRVTQVEDFPKARKPAYKLSIDFGPFGTRRSSAQLTALYRAEDLIGRLVLAVTNLPPRQIADFRSEVLVLGLVPNDTEVILVGPDRDVPLGTRLA